MAPPSKSPKHAQCMNPQCPLYNPPGHHITEKGYWRIHQRLGGYRNWYLHRWVIAQVIGKDPGPEVEIHHLDFDAKNCCPQNLMILDYCIHQAFENSSRRQTQSGVQGFQSRPAANAEIDWLVVDMLWADMQNRGDKWSPTEALARRDREINPKRGQQGLFD